MKKYTDGTREIFVTEKAYNLLYKSKGFEEVKKDKKKKGDK